jgi:hypothetical protein
MKANQVQYVDQALANVGGRFFRVDFIKKDGSVRKLIGRRGVTKHVKGTGKPPANPNIVTVWDTQNGAYRSFDKRRVLSIRSGMLYVFYDNSHFKG